MDSPAKSDSSGALDSPAKSDSSGALDSPVKSDSSGVRRPRNRTLDSQLSPLKFKDDCNDDDLTIGFLSLNKPSGIRNAPNWEHEVCLDLADPSDRFSMRILRGINHQNILRLEAILGPAVSDESTKVKICVEKYTESLYHFVSNDFDISQRRHLEMLQKLLGQVAEGLDELRLLGLYHGNLNLHTTYFDRPSELIKLANFKEKDDEQELPQAQLSDWHAAGTLAGQISALQKINNPTVDCRLLDDLATTLNNLPPHVRLDQVKGLVLDHVFFWKRSRISSFFIYRIPTVFDDLGFIARLGRLYFVPFEWTKDDHDGLLTAMNKYRTEQKMPVYSNGRHQYIKFVSGAFTHEDELHPRPDVHMIIKTKCPQLCLELVKIVRELGYPV